MVFRLLILIVFLATNACVAQRPQDPEPVSVTPMEVATPEPEPDPLPAACELLLQSLEETRGHARHIQVARHGQILAGRPRLALHDVEVDGHLQPGPSPSVQDRARRRPR